MSDPFLGSIALFGFNFPPRGWATCDGQLLPINNNTALFSLLGTTYGGDGRTNFALPDLRGRTPMHLSAANRLGTSGGATTHTLTFDQMGSHTHAAMVSPAGGQGTAEGNVWGTSPDGTLLYEGVPDRPMSNSVIRPTGVAAPAAHENMSPYLVMNWCIALVGIYPSRN